MVLMKRIISLDIFQSFEILINLNWYLFNQLTNGGLPKNKHVLSWQANTFFILTTEEVL